MRPKDDKKTQAIREKAIEMIVNEGFDGLSMQKLAKAANVSPATIYIYFKNREDLLNQLYNDVQQTFSDVALKGFDPDIPFEQGLWIQWNNRLKFIMQYPLHYTFFEQFRNSHLVNHTDIKISEFKENMRLFVMKAMDRGEIKKMEPEIFWSVAYGTLYSLARFHLQEKTMMNNNFKLTDAIIKEAFAMVIKAFKP